MKTLYLFLALSCLLLSSCFHRYNSVSSPQVPLRKVWGLKPVYAYDTSYRVVTYSSQSRPVVQAGNIYVKDRYIFQCEVGEGIHVIDKSDPARAKKVGFLVVKGCEQIAMKGNYLYANNYYDLVTIDMSNPSKAKVVSRSAYAFYGSLGDGPHTWEMPKDTGWFECPAGYRDSVIVNWVHDSIYTYCRH